MARQGAHAGTSRERQTIAKVESRPGAPSNKVALNGPAHVWGYVCGMTMPDCAIEDDHHTAVTAAQDFARVFCTCVRESITRKIGPVVRRGHKARRSVLSPERIDHEDESK